MRKILLVLLCFCANLARGQVFEPGYVVVHGDTLRGEVENSFWEDTPTSIRFRSAAGTLTTYSKHQLSSAYLASGRLLRKEVLPIDRTAQTDITRLTTSPVGQQQQDSVLADVLVIGPASLLGVTLRNVKHFFVQRETQPYLEVAERRYLVKDASGGTRIADGNDYKNKLRIYFGDCPAAMAASDKASFTAEGLKAIVQAYNQQCSASGHIGREIQGTQPKHQRVIVRLGIMAGARYNSLRAQSIGYTAQTQTVLNNYNFDGRLNAQGGIYADLVDAGRRLALHTSLLISRFGQASVVALPTLDANEPGSFERHGTLFTLQYGLRYFAPVGQHLQLVFGSGFELNQGLTSTAKFNYNGTDKKFLYGFNSTLLPYLEAGISRSRLSFVITGRSYKKEEFSHYASRVDPRLLTYKVNPWSLGVLFGYRLNSNPDLQGKSN